MCFSFIHTSDLIIELLEMIHVHSSCIANMKTLKAISNKRASSNPESVKSNDNNILN